MNELNKNNKDEEVQTYWRSMFKTALSFVLSMAVCLYHCWSIGFVFQDDGHFQIILGYYWIKGLLTVVLLFHKLPKFSWLVSQEIARLCSLFSTILTLAKYVFIAYLFGNFTGNSLLVKDYHLITGFFGVTVLDLYRLFIEKTDFTNPSKQLNRCQILCFAQLILFLIVGFFYMPIYLNIHKGRFPRTISSLCDQDSLFMNILLILNIFAVCLVYIFDTKKEKYIYGGNKYIIYNCKEGNALQDFHKILIFIGGMGLSINATASPKSNCDIFNRTDLETKNDCTDEWKVFIHRIFTGVVIYGMLYFWWNKRNTYMHYVKKCNMNFFFVGVKQTINWYVEHFTYLFGLVLLLFLFLRSQDQPDYALFTFISECCVFGMLYSTNLIYVDFNPKTIDPKKLSEINPLNQIYPLIIDSHPSQLPTKPSDLDPDLNPNSPSPSLSSPSVSSSSLKTKKRSKKSVRKL